MNSGTLIAIGLLLLLWVSAFSSNPPLIVAKPRPGEVCVNKAWLSNIHYKACAACVEELGPSECVYYCAGVKMNGFMGMKDIP